MSDSHNNAPQPGDAPVIHTYDDIQECDNKLPNWWLYTLFGSIVFAMCYWLYYHTFTVGELPLAQYKHEAAAQMAKGSGGKVTNEMLVALTSDPAAVAEGKQVFMANCALCHKTDAGGSIGPNLTDKNWIHDPAPHEIHELVTNGIATKGMPAWGPQLGPDRVRNVVAYVLTLKNTNVQGGKPPQGDIVAE